METILLFCLVLMHLYFLYYVFTRVSILWAVACIIVPILCLYIYYREWQGLRIVFFLELGLTVALILIVK
jgi:hypothetical protein